MQRGSRRIELQLVIEHYIQEIDQGCSEAASPSWVVETLTRGSRA